MEDDRGKDRTGRPKDRQAAAGLAGRGAKRRPALSYARLPARWRNRRRTGDLGRTRTHEILVGKAATDGGLGRALRRQIRRCQKADRRQHLVEETAVAQSM